MAVVGLRPTYPLVYVVKYHFIWSFNAFCSKIRPALMLQHIHLCSTKAGPILLLKVNVVFVPALHESDAHHIKGPSLQSVSLTQGCEASLTYYNVINYT